MFISKNAYTWAKKQIPLEVFEYISVRKLGTVSRNSFDININDKYIIWWYYHFVLSCSFLPYRKRSLKA